MAHHDIPFTWLFRSSSAVRTFSWKHPAGLGGGIFPMSNAGRLCPAGSSPSPRGTHNSALADFMDSNLKKGNITISRGWSMLRPRPLRVCAREGNPVKLYDRNGGKRCRSVVHDAGIEHRKKIPANRTFYFDPHHIHNDNVLRAP